MSIKLITFLTLALVFFAVDVGAEPDSGNIFDNNSDFMSGFETGLFLRSKGGKLEDYDCGEVFKGSKRSEF